MRNATLKDIIISNFKNKTPTGDNVITIEIYNYNNKKNLAPYYIMQGVEYSDDGKFNDKKANDGIYTSVKKHKVTLSFTENNPKNVVSNLKT